MHIIANLKFGQWTGRLNLDWNGPGDGKDEFKSAMNRIETVAGPTSQSIQEFVEKCKAVFRKAGFEITQP